MKLVYIMCFLFLSSCSFIVPKSLIEIASETCEPNNGLKYIQVGIFTNNIIECNNDAVFFINRLRREKNRKENNYGIKD